MIMKIVFFLISSNYRPSQLLHKLFKMHQVDDNLTTDFCDFPTDAIFQTLRSANDRQIVAAFEFDLGGVLLRNELKSHCKKTRNLLDILNQQ